MTRDSWAIWIALVIGLWLIVAPFALALSGAPLIADVALGVLIVATSFWGIVQPAATIAATWMVSALAVCTFVAPFVLGYAHLTRAMLNDTMAGTIALIFALLALALEVQRDVRA